MTPAKENPAPAFSGSKNPDLPISIEEILEKESVVCYFQPLISPFKKTAAAVEALSRGIHPRTGEILSPAFLFSEAEKKGLSVELDRLCRKKAVENFAAGLGKRFSRLILSLNFDTAIIDRGVVGSNQIYHTISEAGLDPRRVALELIESRAENLSDLQTFVNTYRRHGFLIAIDDIGAGHSNLDRIARLHPDIIKLDRYLVHNAHAHYHQREVIKALTALSRRIGSVVVAEGVEKEEDALFCLENGADWIQGFYFSKPEPQPFSRESLKNLKNKNRCLLNRFKDYRLKNLQVRQQKEGQLELLFNALVSELSLLPEADFEKELKTMVESHSALECAYVLNPEGIQITGTLLNEKDFSLRRQMLFKPDEKGADQSFREYFMRIQTGLEKHLTDPYISAASGNLCRTVSGIFQNFQVKKFILCLDVREKEANSLSLKKSKKAVWKREF